jgi:N-acetyl-anhydromuramyl-L-alanine amidase AmpD
LVHDRAIRSQAVLVRDWRPQLPAGTLRSVVLHWTAGDYATTFDAYHFCLSGAAGVCVHATHDLRANMRDVRTDASRAYAAHTQGRNSYAAGIAVCAMRGATPEDFGLFPLTGEQIEALCTVAAALVRCYGIALANVRTHAEAAREDGYFGAHGADVRWDIARLEASGAPLCGSEALAAGDILRRRIARLI